MSSPVVYFALTSHGFGHAARCAAIANEIKQLKPEITVILSTVAPHWLLDSCIQGDFIQRHRQFDVGVVQADSLRMDKVATYQRWQEIHHHKDRLIASEAEYLVTNQVKLVVGDIPPLAGAIAQAAGVPCWLMGNFGWDFIYQDWGGEYVELAEQIRADYSQSDRLFRLPMHEPMASFPTIEDRGLVGNHPAQSLDHLREKFNLEAPKEKTILLSFGGMGVNALPYQDLALFSDWQFISFDQQAPDLPNLIKISTHTYRPVDFMPLCDRVISKPGYSTFAEALMLDLPVVSVTRSDFAEGPILLETLRDHGHHQIITPEQLFNDGWAFLKEEPQAPRTDVKLSKDGTESIAQTIVDYVNG